MSDDERGTPQAGEPLDAQVRRRLERLLGRSLAGLRVHDDAQAEQLVTRLGAEAFTLGQHVYARRGGRRAHQPADLGLLAHEATHVVQQTNPAALTPAGDDAGGAAAPLAIQRATSGAGVTQEQAATQVETEAAHPDPGAGSGKGGGGADPEAVAERVYALIVRDLQLERERGVR